MPYGTFRYRVFMHRIVTADDLAVLQSHGREIVELQACHPRFFASHRYIVYARLVRIDPRGAPPISAPCADAGGSAARLGAGLSALRRA